MCFLPPKITFCASETGAALLNDMRLDFLTPLPPTGLCINVLSVLYGLEQQIAPGWNNPAGSIQAAGLNPRPARGCWRWPYVGNAENAVFFKTFCNFFPGLISYGKQLHHRGRKKHQIGLDSAQFGA